MPASPSKSKGAGTILLVLLLLLAVAGASAFFIHRILTAEDAPVVAGGSGPSQTGDDLGPPVVLSPGGTPGQGNGAIPEGQFVVPPTSVPGQPGAETPADGSGQSAGQLAGQPGTAATSPDGSPASAAGGATEPAAHDGLPADPAPNLLLVPGAMEPPPATAKEDAVVRPAFVNDIAAFLAQNYWPRNTHPSARRSGITTASLQWANLRYGAELQGLEGRRSDPGVARRAILGYILNPTAVGRIYGLYSDVFVAALNQEADKRTVGEGDGKRSLSVQEKREMFSIYSGFAARVAGALERYAEDPSIPAKVKAYSEAEQAVQDANRIYMESMIAYEEASAGDDKTRTTAAQLRMDKEAATYQKRIRERETARDVLVAAMNRDKSLQGADTLVYAAFWAYRRGGDSAPALKACAKALNDMSAKLAAAAKQIQ